MLIDLIKFRQELHKHPELSGEEKETAKLITSELEECQPTAIIREVGGHGVLASFKYGKRGPVILFRCELDALPIQESNTFAHRSRKKGISHKCGHDGHMAILIGVARSLNSLNLKNGTVHLLFQPAEETGKGAQLVLDDSKFPSTAIDYVFALHNLPGYPMHHILTFEPWFTATVQSMDIQLKGKTAHAAEPEMGINPAYVVANIINEFKTLEQPEPIDKDFALITIVHIKVGEKDYGISPASGELHLTLRTWSTVRMESLKKDIERSLKNFCAEHLVSCQFEYLEYFPAVKNDPACCDQIKQAASKSNLELLSLSHPLRFGEDFGWYSQNYKSAMFGIGTGIDTPALHQNDYDFPDEIIPTGITMFTSIIKQILA